MNEIPEELMTMIPYEVMKHAKGLLSEQYGDDRPIDPGLERLVARAILSAQAEQRERDARIADDHGAPVASGQYGRPFRRAAELIADAIRRGEA